MANSNTERSKAARAATARAAMKKRRERADYKQFAIGGDAAVINRLIAALDATGEPSRIRQLEALLDKLPKSPQNG